MPKIFYFTFLCTFCLASYTNPSDLGFSEIVHAQVKPVVITDKIKIKQQHTVDTHYCSSLSIAESGAIVIENPDNIQGATTIIHAKEDIVLNGKLSCDANIHLELISFNTITIAQGHILAGCLKSTAHHIEIVKSKLSIKDLQLGFLGTDSLTIDKDSLIQASTVNASLHFFGKEIQFFAHIQAPLSNIYVNCLGNIDFAGCKIDTYNTGAYGTVHIHSRCINITQNKTTLPLTKGSIFDKFGDLPITNITGLELSRILAENHVRLLPSYSIKVADSIDATLKGTSFTANKLVIDSPLISIDSPIECYSLSLDNTRPLKKLNLLFKHNEENFTCDLLHVANLYIKNARVSYVKLILPKTTYLHLSNSKAGILSIGSLLEVFSKSSSLAVENISAFDTLRTYTVQNSLDLYDTLVPITQKLQLKNIVLPASCLLVEKATLLTLYDSEVVLSTPGILQEIYSYNSTLTVNTIPADFNLKKYRLYGSEPNQSSLVKFAKLVILINLPKDFLPCNATGAEKLEVKNSKVYLSHVDKLTLLVNTNSEIKLLTRPQGFKLQTYCISDADITKIDFLAYVHNLIVNNIKMRQTDPYLSLPTTKSIIAKNSSLKITDLTVLSSVRAQNSEFRTINLPPDFILQEYFIADKLILDDGLIPFAHTLGLKNIQNTDIVINLDNTAYLMLHTAKVALSVSNKLVKVENLNSQMAIHFAPLRYVLDCYIVKDCLHDSDAFISIAKNLFLHGISCQTPIDINKTYNLYLQDSHISLKNYLHLSSVQANNSTVYVPQDYMLGLFVLNTYSIKGGLPKEHTLIPFARVINLENIFMPSFETLTIPNTQKLHAKNCFINVKLPKPATVTNDGATIMYV